MAALQMQFIKEEKGRVITFMYTTDIYEKMKIIKWATETFKTGGKIE
jgi:hypothetical protein